MTALWLTEADVVALLDLRGAISAVEAGLVGEASGAGAANSATKASEGVQLPTSART